MKAFRSINEHKIKEKTISNLKNDLKQISILIDKYQNTDDLDLIKIAYKKSSNICKILKYIYNTE